MTKINRSWDILTKEQRQSAINEIIDFFSTERDEEIGVIAAESILDMFLQTTGMWVYNKGVDDAKEFIKSRFEEAFVEIEISLKKD